MTTMTPTTLLEPGQRCVVCFDVEVDGVTPGAVMAWVSFAPGVRVLVEFDRTSFQRRTILL